MCFCWFVIPNRRFLAVRNPYSCRMLLKHAGRPGFHSAEDYSRIACISSGRKSFQDGFVLLITTIFFSRRQPLICFSRAIAFTTSEKVST